MDKEIKDMSPEDRDEEWSGWVKKQVNTLLDFYLKKAISSNINIKYIPHVVELLETGPVINENMSDGVVLTLEILFEQPEVVEK